MRKLSALAAAALFVSVFTLGLVPAKADTVENLSFTGFATCQDLVFNCGGDGSGPVTGTYSLDVDTQTIIGPWSFTLPFAVIASTDPGATATAVVLPPPYTPDVEVAFVEEAGFLEFVRFDFAPGDLEQIGVPVFSNACQSIPNTTSCQPQYGIQGTMTVTSVTTTLPAPEPASLLLLALGALVVPFVFRSALCRT